MLRLDPGDHRIWTARDFHVYEGGGEYNVARGLSALAPFTIGALSQRYGLSWAFGTSAIAFAAAALLGLLLPETQGASL